MVELVHLDRVTTVFHEKWLGAKIQQRSANDEERGKNLPLLLRRLLLIFIVLLLGFSGFRNRLDGWLYGILGKGQDPWAILSLNKVAELISKFTGSELGDQSF